MKKNLKKERKIEKKLYLLFEFFFFRKVYHPKRYNVNDAIQHNGVSTRTLQCRVNYTDAFHIHIDRRQRIESCF